MRINSLNISQNYHALRTYNVKSVQYGTETLPFIGSKIWFLVPSNVKNSDKLQIFWKPDTCPALKTLNI